MGCYFGNAAAERIDAVEATLKRYDADVIGIQEMCPNWYENDKTQSIDHVVFFKDELKVKEQRVVGDQDILNASDHSPVYVDFEF